MTEARSSHKKNTQIERKNPIPKSDDSNRRDSNRRGSNQHRGTQAAVISNEAQLRAVIENTPDRIWSIDSEYRLLVANESFHRGVESQIGRRLIQGESVLEPTFSSKIATFWKPLYDRALAGESFSLQIPSLVLRPGGVIECHLNPIRDVNGMVTGVAGRSFDVTDRLQAEMQMSETLQRLRLAMRAANIGIWNWTFADDSLYWDDRLVEIYALSEEERAAGIDHSVWRKRVHPDDLPAIDTTLAEARRKGADWEATFRIVRPDGEIRHVYASCVFEYDPNGLPLRMIGINRDITERVRLEQMLHDANAALEERVATRTAQLVSALEELKRAGRAKNEFLTVVSHELRTPLSAILGAADVLALESLGTLTERQKTTVEIIRTSGRRLQKLVNDLLRYASLVAGKTALQRKRHVLADLAANCMAKISEATARNQQSATFAVTPPTLNVFNDADAISSVLDTLLDNAVKFTPPGGHITLDVDAFSDKVRFVVSDTGIGIDPEKQALIFQPFIQADSGLARAHEGIGLGLAYVAQMVEAMNGTISVESKPGSGSKFTVILPAILPMPTDGQVSTIDAKE